LLIETTVKQHKNYLECRRQVKLLFNMILLKIVMQICWNKSKKEMCISRQKKSIQFEKKSVQSWS